jgi:hypothetical protein
MPEMAMMNTITSPPAALPAAEPFLSERPTLSVSEAHRKIVRSRLCTLVAAGTKCKFTAKETVDMVFWLEKTGFAHASTDDAYYHFLSHRIRALYKGCFKSTGSSERASAS